MQLAKHIKKNICTLKICGSFVCTAGIGRPPFIRGLVPGWLDRRHVFGQGHSDLGSNLVFFFVCLLFISFSLSPSSLSSSHSLHHPLTHTYTKWLLALERSPPPSRPPPSLTVPSRRCPWTTTRANTLSSSSTLSTSRMCSHLHRISRTPLSHIALPLCPLHAAFTCAALDSPLPYNLCARSDNA